MAVTARRTWSGVVEQVIEGDRTVTLHKERVQVDGEVPLALVRKHLPGGPTLPPVLLVHGFAQNRYSWHTSRRSPSAWLASRGWDVWNLELRGHGRSREVGELGAERFHDYVADILSAAQALPAPAWWIGHSLGGSVLYAAASERPQATRGVVGLGALYRFAHDNPLLGPIARLSHRLPLDRLQVRTRLLGVLMSRLYGVSDILGYSVPVSGWWPGSIEPELLAERLDRGFDWTSFRVWREMAGWSTDERVPYDAAWRTTDIPLLVILGDKDHLAPPKDGEPAYERSGSQDRTLLVLDDWHNQVHWGHLDLTIGTHALREVWPMIDEWMRARS